jgi:hypothetical protein
MKQTAFVSLPVSDAERFNEPASKAFFGEIGLDAVVILYSHGKALSSHTEVRDEELAAPEDGKQEKQRRCSRNPVPRPLCQTLDGFRRSLVVVVVVVLWWISTTALLLSNRYRFRQNHYLNFPDKHAPFTCVQNFRSHYVYVFGGPHCIHSHCIHSLFGRQWQKSKKKT